MIEQRSVERIKHTRQQARSLHRAASEQHERLGATVVRHEPSCLPLATAPKHKVRGQAIRKIFHHNHALKRS